MRLGERHQPDCCCERCICEKENAREYLKPIIQAAFRQLTDGSPVPEDNSHTKLRPDGQQEGYVVLSPEERAKGFVKPIRRTYIHTVCGTSTTMGTALAETYARDPHFYSGTFCASCHGHFPLADFKWTDGEPMSPVLQAIWHVGRTERLAREAEDRRQRRIAELRKELAELEGSALSEEPKHD